MDISSIIYGSIKIAGAVSTVASIVFFDIGSIKKSSIYKAIKTRYNNYNHPGYTEKDILEHLDTVSNGYPPIEEEFDTITKSQVLNLQTRHPSYHTSS